MDRLDALRALHQAFAQQRWIFAKTMPENPHEYTLRQHWNAAYLSFDDAVALIRGYGYPAYFKRRRYLQFNVLDAFYWTMGAPIEETILINRAKIDKDTPMPYDAIAEAYDAFFDDEASQAETIKIVARAQPYVQGKTLDIGCGTGSVSKLLHIAEHVGIDPSRPMLERFAQNCPTAQRWQSRYEDFPHTGFDSAISLFGAINYVSPRALSALDTQLRDGGTYYLMFYKEGYVPITHVKANADIPFFPVSAYQFPIDCDVQDFSNYHIVCGVKHGHLWH